VHACRYGMSRRFGAALAALTLASCQSYEAQPLDLSASRADWHGRTLEDGSLRSLLQRLELDVESAAGEFDPADGLSLEEGRLVALVFHPDLRIARLRAGLAQASSEHAGRWDDPEFSIDVLRITENVSKRWVVTPSLAFSLPISGRLAAERALADANGRAALQAVLEAEWAVVHEVGQAWTLWSAAQLRHAETERLLTALEGPTQMAQRLAESGEVSRAMASLFELYAARETNHLRGLQGDVLAAEAHLRAQLGLAPEAPIRFLPQLTVKGAEGTAAELGERNPTLAVLREQYDVSEEALRHEIKKQYPDLTLGPLYESDAGQSRVGFLGGLPLPFLNANKGAIAEARIERELAGVALTSEYESLVGRWDAAVAQARGLAAQAADFDSVLAPLADRQLEDALQLMRLGEDTGLVLLESLQTVHELKLERIETRSAEALARAQIQFLLGPSPSPGAENTPR